jgi:hypothetical protein
VCLFVLSLVYLFIHLSLLISLVFVVIVVLFC